MRHEHYFTRQVDPPWWAFWRAPRLVCRCGKDVNQVWKEQYR